MFSLWSTSPRGRTRSALIAGWQLACLPRVAPPNRDLPPNTPLRTSLESVRSSTQSRCSFQLTRVGFPLSQVLAEWAFVRQTYFLPIPIAQSFTLMARQSGARFFFLSFPPQNWRSHRTSSLVRKSCFFSPIQGEKLNDASPPASGPNPSVLKTLYGYVNLLGRVRSIFPSPRIIRLFLALARGSEMPFSRRLGVSFFPLVPFLSRMPFFPSLCEPVLTSMKKAHWVFLSAWSM